MQHPGEAQLFTHFYRRSRSGRTAAPLYEVIVEEAKKTGMAGATVLKGVMRVWKRKAASSIPPRFCGSPRIFLW